MRTSPRTQTPTSRSTTSSAPRSVSGTGLLSSDERDKLQLRLQHAVNGFVDEPRPAVEAAGELLDDLALRIHQLVDERRGALRESWQDAGGKSGTEELRIALRSYRELAERLLRL